MYDNYAEELWREFIKKHSSEIFSKIHKIFSEFDETEAQRQQILAQQNQNNNYYNPNNNTFELSAVKEKPIYQNQNINSKYAGLTPMQKAQKAASKSHVSTTEGHYYGLASRLNDGDKLSKYDKDQNNIYSVKDFNGKEHGQSYAQKAAKMKGLDINNPADYEKIQNTKVVMPKEGSALYNHAKNSDTTKQWIAQNYEKYKNGTIKPEDQHIQYPGALLNNSKRALFGTIHNAEMNKSKLNPDGSFTVWPDDGYDFDKLNKIPLDLTKIRNKNDLKTSWQNFKHNRFVPVNNRAYEQQQKGQLENYILSMPITYTKEEVDNIINNNHQNTISKLLEELMKHINFQKKLQ